MTHQLPFLQCGIEKCTICSFRRDRQASSARSRRYFCCTLDLGSLMTVFFSTSKTEAVSWSPNPIAIASL
jgi:hypothetical protein